MASNYRAYAVHTAVATLNIAPVEQLVVPVISWEVLIYQLEELACYIGGDTLVVCFIDNPIGISCFLKKHRIMKYLLCRVEDNNFLNLKNPKLINSVNWFSHRIENKGWSSPLKV